MTNRISLSEKFLLTVEEAAIYFGIGENKLRELIELDEPFEFSLFNGNRKLIKRRKFETWLEKQSIL